MSPSGLLHNVSQSRVRHHHLSMASGGRGGARPKRNLRMTSSSFQEDLLEEDPYSCCYSYGKREDIRELRSSLCELDRRLSRALGMPPGLEPDRLSLYQEEEQEELLLMRRSIIQMDARLSILLDPHVRKGGKKKRREYEDPLLEGREYSAAPSTDVLLLGRSVQQCLKGLSKLSQDVNRLRHSFLRETRGRRPPASLEEESTLFDEKDDEEELPSSHQSNLNNNQTAHRVTRRPNNYWDNFRSFSRTNPLMEAPTRRVKSKINRENNVDPGRGGGHRGTAATAATMNESKKKTRLYARLPSRILVPDVNLTESPLSKKHFSKIRSLPEPSDEEEEEFKSVFDVVLLSQESFGDRESERDPVSNVEEISEASGQQGSLSNNNNNTSSSLEGGASSSTQNNNNVGQDVDCLIETGKMNDLSLEDEEVFKIENTFFLSGDEDEEEHYQSQDSGHLGA